MSGSIARTRASDSLYGSFQKQENQSSDNLSNTNVKISQIKEKINYQKDTSYSWKMHNFFHVKNEKNCLFCVNNSSMHINEDQDGESQSSEVSFTLRRSETDKSAEDDLDNEENDVRSVDSFVTDREMVIEKLKVDALEDPEKVIELLIYAVADDIIMGFDALYDLLDSSRYVSLYGGCLHIVLNDGERAFSIDSRPHIEFAGSSHISSKMIVCIARELSPHPLHDCMKSRFGSSKKDMHQLINAFLDAEGVDALIGLLHSENEIGLTPVQVAREMKKAYHLEMQKLSLLGGSQSIEFINCELIWSGCNDVIAYLEELEKEEVWLLDIYH